MMAMAEPGVFLRRSLCSAEYGSLRFLDTLRWPTPTGTGLRSYLARGSEIDLLKTAADGGVRLSDVTVVAGNAVATGTAPRGAGPVVLTLGSDTVTVPTCQPELALFDDLNVFLALRHLETVDQVADWLAFHVRFHRLTGVVLFDRSEPGATQVEFSDALECAVNKITEIQRFVLVNASIALGYPNQPALGDPALAPRAKDRSFTADPWRAPLHEPVLYDILKSRFLARAGAVIALDPCDTLRVPGDGIGAFDACRQSHTGLMQVRGHKIYPWRVRRRCDAVLGDHICRAEPPATAPLRWALAPKRANAGAICLPGTVAGMAGLIDEVVEYDRALSVLFPHAEVSALVNKETLLCDDELLTRARDVFSHKPVLPPKRKPAPALPIMTQPSARTLIVTCMKNEGPFILEWLAYHRLIGVDDFLIYTNDCDDGTDALLDALQARGLVQRRDNPFKKTGARPQRAALGAAQTEPLAQQAGWIISMDVDEFINIHAGANRLPDLYAAISGADLISMTWRLFGNSDVNVYEDRPVIEQFTRCAPQLIRRPHQAWGYKTLFRNRGLFDRFGVHRPKGFRGGAAHWVNGSGKPMPKSTLNTGWRSGVDSYGYDLVTLNHYAVRSVESFLVKRDRGRVNHVARDQGEGYWFRMNNNDQQDLSIQRHKHGLKAAIDDLLADAEIAALHAYAVAAHRARIASLMQRQDFAALYELLCSERMQRLSRMHRHFGMNVFLHGPSVVPDSVLDPDLPANFFFNARPHQGKAAE